MSARSASEIAYEAANLIRALSYATLPYEGYPGLENPADVYDVIGALEILAQRAPQALQQVSGWLQDQHNAGNVGHASGEDPYPYVTRTCAALIRAADGFVQAQQALHDAHIAASGLKAAREDAQ